MPSKTERVKLTPEQVQSLLEYAEKHTGGNKSDAIRQALARMIPGFPADAPQAGRRRTATETYQCLWCKHIFNAVNPMECPKCGEDEFQIIENKEKK